MSKKGSKNTQELSQYDVGQVVLGKIRGFPPWPGMVVDPDSVPPSVSAERPPGKKAPFYAVIFFPTGDYGWLHAKDISSLKKHEMESYLADEAKKRNGELREGYRTALDPEPWLRSILAARETMAKEAEDEVDNAEVDELEKSTEGEEDGRSGKKGKTASKKRKRESESEPKPKKTPKPKKEPTGEPTKKRATSATKTKKSGKSKAFVESEDEADNESPVPQKEAAGPSNKASPPPAKKAKRDKDDDGEDAAGDPQSAKVREWRHKLQKTFLPNKSMPKAEDMKAIDDLFKTVETYEDMTIEQLQFSKIGKVMRHIAALTPDKIPKDDVYNFRTRAKELVDKWHQILNANKPNASPSISATGQTNGKDKTKSKDEDEVTQGTKNLDLNGKGASPDAVGEVVGAETGELSMLGDVTMSEA